MVDSVSSVRTEATTAPPSIGRSMSTNSLDAFPSSQMQYSHHSSYTLPEATEGRYEYVAQKSYTASVFQNRSHVDRSELDSHNKGVITDDLEELANQKSKAFTTAHPITMVKVTPHGSAPPPPSLHVALCLDRSGSMGPYMQKALDAAKTILHGLVERITQQKLTDVRVTLMSFGSRVEEHVRSAPLPTLDAMTSFCNTLDQECAHADMGGTHIEAALCEATSRVSVDMIQNATQQGYVILLTDGEPTSGEHYPLTIKQHLFNEYVGALPISFGAIALGSQPRRAFMEPLFEGGRFAFAVDENGLQEAFTRITDGFDDIDRNLSLVIDGHDVLCGNISQSQEWIHVLDDLVHTERSALPEHAMVGLDPPDTPKVAPMEFSKTTLTATDDAKFAYTPWIYLARGRKGAVDAPARKLLLCMIQRFVILQEGDPSPIFEAPAAMVDHITLLEDQRLLQKAVASAWKDPTEASRVVNTISQRAQARSLSEPPTSAASWSVVRRMSTQASEWLHHASENDGGAPRVKRMRGVSASMDAEADSPSAPPSLRSHTTDMMSFDLCSQSTNS